MIWKMVGGPKDWYTFLKTTKQTDKKTMFLFVLGKSLAV